MNKKVVFSLDSEKYKTLRRIALEEDISARALIEEGIDYVISKNIP